MKNYLPPKEIFEHLYRVVGSERFLQKKGLGNEVPFFICPFAPEHNIEMDQVRQQLVNQLKNDGVTALDVNLYDLSMSLLRERGIWNRIINLEQSTTKSELLDLLRNVLDPEAHIVPAIADLINQNRQHDVMFLSGVGEVYPYIRSHTILNNLQSTANSKPTVMFFPGTYTHSLEAGASLDLFGRLQDDKYYRAFNILHYNV